MLNANEILSTGKSSDKTIYILSNNINNIYFGDMNLAFKVKNYNKIVETALNSKNEKDFLDALTNISNQSESLLIDLNSTVLQYQKEGEEKINLRG